MPNRAETYGESDGGRERLRQLRGKAEGTGTAGTGTAGKLA